MDENQNDVAVINVNDEAQKATRTTPKPGLTGIFAQSNRREHGILAQITDNPLFTAVRSFLNSKYAKSNSVRDLALQLWVPR